ncbi:MAG TPA: D-alanine--D-alanine ligase [Candidatus Saccharimonadales bacterium]|nr:D-alanine--D-alanine ligase [Candidatus Saccharimonadales bacterium]
MNIAVLAGGTSGEREISLRSGAAVAKALQTKGHVVTLVDPLDGLDLIDTGTDVVFPALHGAGGEDGTIQMELEKRGIAYVGSDSVASALCFDKWAYRDRLRETGLPIAEGEMVNAQSFWRSPLSKKPYVLKPVDGGSTIDTFIVRDPTNADQQKIKEALARYDEMLLEELVEGIEITVGVLGDQALPPVEIIPPEGGEFDYENKYNGKTRELCPAENIGDAAQKKAKSLALRAHAVAGCKDLSRTDIIVRKDGSQVILETNTLPGMTGQSLYPKAAAAAGIGFADLVDRLVAMATV